MLAFKHLMDAYEPIDYLACATSAMREADNSDRIISEIAKFCGMVDAMVVVGGKGSANTRRLVSICRSKGIPTYHIERSEEINDRDFSGYNKVGVTAGASTPRWLINHTLEEIERADKSSFYGLVRRFAKFCVYSYLALSVAAAALSYVFTTYMELPTDFRFAAIAFMYVYALYNINVYFMRKKKERSGMEASRFLHKYKVWLISTTFLCLAGALFLSSQEGTASLVIVAASILLGILFSVELFSLWLIRKSGVKSLQDIPGSKDLFSPLALSTVIVLVPVFSDIPTESLLQIIISFLITASLIFLRSTLLKTLRISSW